MRVFSAVVTPTARLAIISAAEILPRCAIGTHAVIDDVVGAAMALERFLEESQRSATVAYLCHKAFQNLAFMSDRAPKTVLLALYLLEDFVEMPLVQNARSHAVDRAPTDLGGKYRPQPVPPEPHGLLADLDAAFVQQIFDIAQRQRVPDLEHHRQPYDLRARLEVAKREEFCHSARLAGGPTPLQAKFL